MAQQISQRPFFPYFSFFPPLPFVMPALTSTFLSLVPFAAAVFYIVYLQLERSELLQRLESIKLTENIDTPQASIDILTSPPSPFLSRNKANSAKLDQCMDSLARVNSESALLKYQALRKSAFFDGFNTIFQDPVLLVNKSKDLIPAALTAVKAMQMDSSSRISAIPSLVSSYQDFDTLPRLSNLVDISNHPDLYLIITLHPETTNLSNSKLMPPTHYPNPPRYYEMRTCHNALFSEFIHVTEESYRCVHDMNREEPTKDWPMDRPRYHLPTLVVTKNAEITDRGIRREESVFGESIG